MVAAVPPELNPALKGIAWLHGHWEGTGFREWPGEPKIRFAQQIDFSDNGGPYLHYLSQIFQTDDSGKAIRPLSMETGFWIPLPDGTVDVVLSSSAGYSEIWYGKLQPGRIDLTTDAVVRSPAATVAYTSGRRLYGNVDGKLMYSFDRSTSDQPLRPYLWATLLRR